MLRLPWAMHTQHMFCKESCTVPNLCLNLFIHGCFPPQPGDPEVTGMCCITPRFLLCCHSCTPAALLFQVRILGTECSSKAEIDNFFFFSESMQCKFLTWSLKLNVLENPNYWGHFPPPTILWWEQLCVCALNPSGAGLLSLPFPEPWHCFPARVF